jgi:lipid-binding SYLF domain-containing protein
MTRNLTLLTICGLIGLAAAGCATAPDPSDRGQLSADARDALAQAQATDPTLSTLLKSSPGYAVFPRVGKGAAVVGGSYGRGAVYEGGILVGYTDVTQATVGLQAGAQEFREVVVFETPQALARFKAGKVTLAASYSAVALKTGAGGSARYTDGVAVFVEPIGGLMFEAAIGGQQFTYQPG